MGTLNHSEATDCCKAFLSTLYTPLVYRNLHEIKQQYLGIMASEKSLMEWIIHSIMTYNPDVSKLVNGAHIETYMKSEYEGMASLGQSPCDVNICNAPECCDALRSTLYGKELCHQWEQLKQVMGFISDAEFMQWCLDNVQQYDAALSQFDEEREEDIAQKECGSFHSAQAVSEVSRPSCEEVNAGFLSRCAVCLHEFQNEAILEQHVLTVHLKLSVTLQMETPNLCHLCTFCSSASTGLTKHYLEIHPYYKPYLCAYCDRTFKHKRHLKAHSIKKHGISDLSQVAPWEVWPKYLCCYCYQRFESEYSLKNHIYYTHSKAEIPSIEDDMCESYDGASGEVGVFQSSTGSTTHYCDLCKFQTGKGRKLVKHYVEVHPYYKPYLCDYCGHTFKHKRHRKEHWYKVHGISDLSQATTLNLWPNNQCCYCKEKFEMESLLKKHIYDIHSKARNAPNAVNSFESGNIADKADNYATGSTLCNTCCICNYVASSDSALQDHMLCHATENQHTCPHCEETFSNRGFVAAHIEDQHTHIITNAAQMVPILAEQPAIENQEESKPLNCSTCCKVFARRSNLAAHNMRCHSKKKSKKSSVLIRRAKKGKTVIPKHVPKPYQCPECKDVKKSFISRSRLEIHIRRTHIGDADITEPSNIRLTKRMFNCKYCNISIKGYYNLIEHIENIHENRADKYICEICGFQTNAVRRFRRHELAKHTVVKDDSGNVSGYYCLKCEEGFAEQILLRDHIYEEHYKPVKTMCDICGKCFVNQSKMKRHRACHSDARTALCPYCSRLFKNNQCLNRHVKHIHNKQKNFSCDQCDFKCSRGFNLRSHKVFAHQNHSNFQCEVCGKYLPNRNHLQQHMNKHGPSGKMQNDKSPAGSLNTAFECWNC